jgi:hypothetical protein
LDKHALIAERERAHQAKHLLENTLYLEAKAMVLNNLAEASHLSHVGCGTFGVQSHRWRIANRQDGTNSIRQ